MNVQVVSDGFEMVLALSMCSTQFLMAIETCTPLVSAALNSLILATNITYAIIKCTPFLTSTPNLTTLISQVSALASSACSTRCRPNSLRVLEMCGVLLL